MANIARLLLIFKLFIFENDAARILAVYPTPSISHQKVFNRLTMELVNRGHEVVVVTTDPMFKKGTGPANLTEIAVDICYSEWRNLIYKPKFINGNFNRILDQMVTVAKAVNQVFEKQISTDAVQRILKDTTKKFDLLIIEAYVVAALGLSHLVKAPVIQISSLGPVLDNLVAVGASMHPILYPTMTNEKIYNLTVFDKLKQLYSFFNYETIFSDEIITIESTIKKLFGEDAPSLSELNNNVDMLFLNLHPYWERNRPVPPNVIYIAGIHLIPEKPLPKDLKKFLDSSKNGVIYFSLGSNLGSDLIAPEKLNIFSKVLSELPYDVLWKWDRDELPGRTKNIKISKWFPQADVLKHPKVKLFITQGGLQSTDEAINAGVPLIGIPHVIDQWCNVEQYVHHKIGLQVIMETITEDILRNAINEILNNDSYRRNIKALHTLTYDQPQTPLERAVWWTEYVIRHGGAKHLRASGANISWGEYLELELVFYLSICILSFTLCFLLLSYKLCMMLKRKRANPKLKNN